MSEPQDQPEVRVRSFWRWLFEKDAEGDRGILNLIDFWNAIGVVISALIAFAATAKAATIAAGIALPVAAALVGISFAWAGRSSSLLQDREYAEFIVKYGAPPEGYVYSFQLAILTSVAAVIVAAILSSEIFIFSTGIEKLNAWANRFVLFSIGWIAGRECWGVISFSNKLAIQFYEVRKRYIGNEDR